MSERAVDVSVVLPLYNEAESIPELYRQVSEACRGLAGAHEIIFVDDGSTDASPELLDRIADNDPRVLVLHFRKNFGKSAALSAAFERAVGRVVVTLDADLQDDPAMIPSFVAAIDEGADLVSGWKKRRFDPLNKRIASRIFNSVVRMVSGIPLHDFNCGFKAYTSGCIRELSVYGGFHRFMPILAHARGFRIEELVVQHRPRSHGRSKFGSGRVLDGFFGLLTVLLVTRYRTRPGHFFGVPGVLLGALGTGILIYLTVLWFLGEAIGTRPLLTFGVLLAITAALLLCIGLLGELLVRTTITPGEVYSIQSEKRGEPAPPESPAERPQPPVRIGPGGVGG